MSNVFIVNASPLILLGKAELLRSVAPLSDLWIVSEGVVAEVESKRYIGTYITELEFRFQGITGVYPSD